MENQYYRINIAGMERDLLRCPLNEHLDIAGFIMFGDVEITVHAASELLKRVPAFDYIVTPEAKSIPLAYEMSRQSGKKYFVARKKAKLYMKDPVTVNVKSITTAGVQTLIMDSLEGEQLRGKRVIVLDDVISTGESLNACVKLCEKFEANIVAKCAVLAEGQAADRQDIIFLAPLPLIEK
ncbi:MAG: adenine phosphoribosyltransferase [Clostridia bacterium]|nr:adenine phosphoribosyltransferase [Clostridia bacterium]